MGWFESLSASLLLTLSALLGINPIPNQAKDPNRLEWTIKQDWSGTPSGRRIVMISKEAASYCRSNQNSYIEFPMVIHGTHSISLDDRIHIQYGDPTFRTTHSFYGAPYLKCAEVSARTQRISWQVDSYTQYFARISFYPRAVESKPTHNLLAEVVHLIAAGGAFLMALFTFTMFYGRVNRSLVFSVAGSCACAGVYFSSCVAGILGLDMPMLDAHKVADIGVWMALVLIINAMKYENFISENVFRSLAFFVLIGLGIIFLGTTGDMIQLGTSLPFAVGVGATSSLAVQALYRLWHPTSDRKLKHVLHVLSMLSFVAVCLNDVLVISGGFTTSPLFPFGFISGVFFLALAVNEKIQETYRERDYLRGNLELEVARKTAELTSKTVQLESAMTSLKSTQAELIQSAKLASLGTLSAGIAHEINNSLNYVNGAMQPLERLVAKSCKEEDHSKIDKLFLVMKDGLSLTLEIIKSLRSYTGLNQAKFNDVNLRTVAQTSTTILRNKLRGKIEVHLDVPESLKIYGSVVGINQVFMNLISNAIDAMKDGGALTIAGKENPDRSIEIKISDTGCGMSAETVARIFEPFFTTKEVGSGTGLGLHIVKNEIDRHKGRVDVESVSGKGTCFTLIFPPAEAVATDEITETCSIESRSLRSAS